MRPSASVTACWLFAALAAVSCSEIVYKKIGDTVVLKPKSGPDPVKSITWKCGPDLAINWFEGSDPDYFRQFKDGHSSLNTRNGQMKITGLTQNDSQKYTAELNNAQITTFDLRVISAVPVPTVSQSCHNEKTSCTLTCDGDSTGAEPVNYTWKADHTKIPSAFTKQHEITVVSFHINHFSCQLVNPVSEESSKPIPNPLLAKNTANVQPKIITGSIVFICLLVPVLLLAVVHRCKAGEWFYEKESMPWNGDFWKNKKTPRDQDAAAHQENRETVTEETPMTLTNRTHT